MDKLKNWFYKNGIRVIGLCILLYVVLTSDWEIIYKSFSKITPIDLIVITLLGVPVWIIKSWRWHYLLRLQSIPYPYRRAFVIYVYTMGLGFFSPGRLAELFKVTFIRQETTATWTQGFISVLTDRALDLLSLLFVVLLSIQLYLLHSSIVSALLITGFAGLLLLMLIIIIKRFRPTAILRRFSQKLASSGSLGQSAANGSDLIIKETEKMLQPRLLVGCLATGIAIVIYFFQSALFANQLGLSLSGLQVGFALALSSIVNLLPISIAGLGTREATVIFVFGLYGISQSEALSFSLLIFSVYFVCSLMITLILSGVIKSK